MGQKRARIKEPSRIKFNNHTEPNPKGEGQRTNLFDRFYQGLEKYYSGRMGVGLYISKHIIDLHGGRIWAEFLEEGGAISLIELSKNAQAGQTSQKA